MEPLMMRDHNGELVTVKDQHDLANKHIDPRTHKAVPFDGLVKFYQAEVDFSENAIDLVREATRDSPKHIQQRIDRITESMEAYANDSAQAATLNITSATKPEMVVMTNEAAEHLIKSLDAMAPDISKYLRGYDKLMSYWRTATLAFTPRWWLNTFVGSAFLTLISGAMKPRYLRAAWHYGGKSERALKFMKRVPGLRPGIFGSEMHELEQMYGGKRPPWLQRKAQGAFTRVENVESFFKRMQFFHQLDKQAKARIRQIDEVLDDYSAIGKMDDNYIDQIMEDPRMVNAAMDSVNKFSYNFTQLGPFERKWVRRVIPFWGWYKFVTKLVWQLPFQYPGRTLVLSKLSDIANEFQDDELGILPPTLKGAIFLNKDRSNLEYMPTFGLNPFADFANPAAPEGTLQGLVNTNQLAPIFQALISATGRDPFTGAPVELSPESGLLQGKYGAIINPETGEEQPGGILGSFFGTRALAGLARSIPQVRTIETMTLGGRYPYPENIPILGNKPVPVDPGTAYGEEGASLFGIPISPELGYILRSQIGALPPKVTNLRDYQRGLREETEYGKTRLKSQRKALRAAGVR